MGWHKRGTRKYHYRSKRVGAKIRKVYFGCGAVGEFAARLHELRQREQERLRLTWQQDKSSIDEALDRFGELHEATELLRDATLLAAGFLRHSRHHWRIWRRGRRFLIQHDCSAVGD